MCKQHDLFFVESASYQFYDFIKIGQELIQIHGRRRYITMKGTARSSLLPINSQVTTFQITVVVTEQRRLADARAPMKKYQR
jgi:hypothetical protein